MTIGWCFDNTYSKLPDPFKEEIGPVPVKNPELVILNKNLSFFLLVYFLNVECYSKTDELNDEKYFYPASTIKLPIAVMALSKINDLRAEGSTLSPKSKIISSLLTTINFLL